MLWLYVKSLGTRVYMDQPCSLKVTSFEPKAEVDTKYKLSEDDIRSFYENGFLGPLTAVSEDEMADFRDNLVQVLNSESEAFGRQTVRDRHLDASLIMELFQRPTITEPLAQLLGPELLIWRSQYFNQEPGAPPITWHQASTYMLEDYKRPILEPVNRNELFQLTTWIAIDEAVVENGCLHFVRGSHSKIRTIRIGGKGGFYNAYFALEFEPDPKDIVPMELRPGQFVIFSERVVHGSHGNYSQNRRMGINFRTITPTTKVYRGQTVHHAVHLEESWKLDNWKIVPLRGKDTEVVSRKIQNAEVVV
jgi:non-heme Fe2+,alpha-ketoglutarate-dependent halogenase